MYYKDRPSIWKRTIIIITELIFIFLKILNYNCIEYIVRLRIVNRKIS